MRKDRKGVLKSIKTRKEGCKGGVVFVIFCEEAVFSDRVTRHVRVCFLLTCPLR